MASIARQPELWKADTYLRDYPQGPFADVDTIFLRFPPASVTELERSAKDQHECVWMDGAISLPLARPMIFALMHIVEGERLGRVMINRIKPGGKIYAHRDTPAHTAYYSRYHYVLHTAPGCSFRAGDEVIAMQTGDLWYFDNSQEHEVINNSGDDRLHLIIDIHLSKPAVIGELPTKPA
jgi:quercetin dioxygenase-like cupin family protein